jgi:hypothetical protein
MSKEASSNPKNPPKSEPGKNSPKKEILIEQKEDKDAEFRSMITSFCQQSVKDQEDNRAAISELRSAISALSKQPPQETSFSLDEAESPYEDRSKSNRRSTIFFGQSSPTREKQSPTQQPRIQVLQTDIVYDKELKISSRRTSISRKTDAATCIKVSWT